jgi:hypothetical protein
MKGSGRSGFGWGDTNKTNWHDSHIKHICRRLDQLQANRTHLHTLSPKRTFTSTPFVRKDSNTLTAKYALKLKNNENKFRKIHRPDLYSKPNLTHGTNGFNIKAHASTSRLRSKIKRRRPKSAAAATRSLNGVKNKTSKLTGAKAAKHVRSTYTKFVRMLAEHYAEEEHEAILQRVKDEATLLQRQMIMKDYADGYEKELETNDFK